MRPPTRAVLVLPRNTLVAGVELADYDNDGWLDIYLRMAPPLPPVSADKAPRCDSFP
jgi:hypothetical protein